MFMDTTRGNRVQYSEEEAAQILGITVDRLRTLVRTHIAKDEDVSGTPKFQASDLVVLRILAGLGSDPSSGGA